MGRPRNLVARAGLLVVGVLVLAGGYVLFFRERPAPPPDARSDKPSPPIPVRQPMSGQDLYAAHCAACHGEKGDGNGPASRFLYPRPRDFGEAQFRLVSTSSNVPSD